MSSTMDESSSSVSAPLREVGIPLQSCRNGKGLAWTSAAASTVEGVSASARSVEHDWRCSFKESIGDSASFGAALFSAILGRGNRRAADRLDGEEAGLSKSSRGEFLKTPSFNNRIAALVLNCSFGTTRCFGFEWGDSAAAEFLLLAASTGFLESLCASSVLTTWDTSSKFCPDSICGNQSVAAKRSSRILKSRRHAARLVPSKIMTVKTVFFGKARQIHDI